MNKLIQKIAAKELSRRQVEVLPNVLEECFPQQLNFITDPDKRKILCLPRRSGKSTAAAYYLINEAIQHPKAKLLYVHLTKSDAKKVMWHDIFETVILKLGIKAELVGLEIRFGNGSIIYLTGVDATPNEMNKLRGKKFRLAVIDECQSFTQDLKQLILQVLTPTLADIDATICLCGTPGNQMGDHYWWQLNKPNSTEKGWKFFTWSWKDNSHVRVNMQKMVDKMLSDNPLVAKTPWFRQEFLGEWVVEADARVYRSMDVNYIEDGYLKPWFYHNCIYNLSLDLGYVDATAYVITAYNQKYDTNLYVLESTKMAGQTITAVAQTIKSYIQKYKFQSIIVDAANLQAVEEMRQIHSLPLTGADKHGKEAHIALMNSDFITNNLFIIKNDNAQLVNELNTLIWDVKALLRGKHKEDGSKDNHLTDALLYGHHASRHYWFKAYAPPLPLEEQIVAEIERQFLPKPPMKTIKQAWWNEEDA